MASVSIAYNDVPAVRSRSSAPQRAAVSLVFDLYHPSSHARGNVSGAVRAAVVSNHNFPRDTVPAKSLVYLLDNKDRKRSSSDPLPYYKLGGLVRFKFKEVMAWVDRRRVRVSSVALL